MAKLIMQVAGIDGQIELLNDRIIIHRAGILNALKYGFNSKRRNSAGRDIPEVAFRDRLHADDGRNRVRAQRPQHRGKEKTNASCRPFPQTPAARF